MITKHLKQWSTFYNSNGYLCLVHKIKGERGQIVNYNGIFYSIKLEERNIPNYSPAMVTPDEFFAAFNTTVFYSPQTRSRYEGIKSRFYVKSKTLKKLLLLC